MIEVEGISKTYGKVLALDDIHFNTKKGELFGLIGPDGAGKTSLFRILTSLLLPDKGRASVAGFDVVKDYKKIRSIIGYMPGRFSLYPDLSVEENLQFFAKVFKTSIEENYHLIKDIYQMLEPFKKRPAGKLSGGMKQKLALSCALIHKPEVLFLDEPTTGVDAVSRKEFWEMLAKLKEQGISILVSTPYMDEAAMCERIALIQNGRIMDINTPFGITQAFPDELFSVSSDNIIHLVKDLREYQELKTAYTFGSNIHITFKNLPDITTLQTYLEKSGHSNIKIIPENAGIEDCFMNLMQNQA
ncbi:MAG: ABC transporter ATP-binding protein [Bacteroidales bacterium]|jgi:ABC-type multidrug transport system ATPase subunit|nr:ABC transporter ATP-binding protein [Bacteroidales bacterium]